MTADAMQTTVVFVAYGVTDLPLDWIPPDAPVVVVHNDGLLDESNLYHLNMIHLYPGRNVGFGHGVNRAAELVDSGRIIICNPDVELDRRHWDALASGAPDDVITVRLRTSAGQPMSSVFPYPTPTLLVAGTFRFARLAPPGSRRRTATGRLLGKWGDDRRWAVETPPGCYSIREHWVSGAVISIDADLFRSVGGFDTDYFLYLEDTDLSQRLADQEVPVSVVVSDAAPGVHEVGGSARDADTARLVRRAQWDSAVHYASGRSGRGWATASIALRMGARVHRVMHPVSRSRH